MSKNNITPETKAKFKKMYGHLPHHAWNEEQVLEKIATRAYEDTSENKPEITSVEPEKKKELKPVHSRLFIPSSGENVKGRTILREDWTDAHTAEYKESYKDRLKKAMKKLK